MPRRYFNWKLAIVLIISICVLGVTAFGLRQWQRTHRADQGLILGNEAYDEQKWDEAAEKFGRYLAIEQIDVPVLMKYAEAQLKIRPSKRGNIAYAEKAYRNVLRTDKYNSKAAMQLAGLYLEMLKPGEAELIASKYLDNNDDPDPKLREMLALAMVRLRKFTEAAAELKAIIQEHPDQISAYEMLGRLTKQRPDDIPDSPESWFDEAVKNNPSSALAYTVRAAFYQSEDSAKAKADLEKAEKLDLSDPNVELRLASEFMNANILDKAEQHLTSVQMSIPSDPRVWAIWAEFALKSKSQEKMLKIAETGLELSSQPLDFMPTATKLFILSGQLDLADDYISEMNQKDIAPPEVAFLEGLLAFEKGLLAFEREQWFKAINHWNESMGLVNKSPPTIRLALSPKIRLALSSALSRIGDTQSALIHLRTLVSENPDFVTGHLELAKLLAHTGNWTESARYAATAKQLSPENPEASLLYLQAKMQLLSTNSASENVQALQDIEKELSEMEKVANNLPEFKLLKFQLALQQSNFTDVQALVTQLKKNYPSQIETTMAEVKLLVAQDKTDEAMLILFKALEGFPQDIKPVRYLAILLYQQGDKEKCEAIIKDALERIDQPVNQRKLGLLLAEIYVQWNQNDKVYSLLNTLAQQLPEDIPIKRGLLLCEQVINDRAKAQQLVDEIKELEGEEGWQWRYEQARIWSSPEEFKARYTEIVELLQENIKANPNDQASRMLLAEAYKDSGELQLAISTYREALSHSPNNLRIIIPFIEVLSSSMEFDEVDQLLKRAGNSKQDLYKPQLKQFQFDSHLRHGQLSSASDILQDFISNDNDPNNQKYRFVLASLKAQQGKYDEAKELLDELKAQSPDSLHFTYALIQLSIIQDKPNEALRLCDEIINKLDNAYAYVLRAGTYSSLGQTDKAREDFEHAAAIEPNSVEVWMAKSAFYRSIGQPDKAIADIQNAMSLAPSDIRIQKQAIRLFLESGDTDKVLQGKAILAEARISSPNDIDLRLSEAYSLLKENTAPAIEKATEILQKITEDQPESSRAWVLLGNISLSKGQAGKAMEIAFRGLSHSPNDMALLLLKARAEKDRSPALAIPTLKALLEAGPNNTEVTLLLAETYIDAGEPEKAVNFLKAQLASRVGTPEERIIKINLAVALYKNGSNANAQKEFGSLIQSEKDSFTLINIANGLASIDDSQAKKTAEDILRMVLRNKPDSVGAMTLLATLLQISDRSDEAILLYKQVLELQPDNKIVINNLAWVMCKDKGMLQEALQLAQKGLDIDPNYVDLIDTRGVIYYKLGEFDKALDDFTTCIALYPKNLKGIPAAIGSRFRLAKTFDKLGQRNEAVEHLNQALDLNQTLDSESRIGGSDLNDAQTLLKQLQEGN